MQWVKDLRMGLEAFGWQGLDMLTCYEVLRQGAMGERSKDGIGGLRVARIGHAGIEWTLTE